jgi:PKHD-type hydroxylase
MLYPIPTSSNKEVTTRYVISTFLKEEGIKKIKNSIDPDKWQDAGVYNEGYNKEGKASVASFTTTGRINTETRKHKLQPLFPIPPDNFPFPEITNLISNVNSNYWKFDLRYINFMRDTPTIFKYTLGGKFNWHFDFNSDAADRKLAYSIQLSDTNDYEGGDLEFFDGDETGKREKDPNLREKGNIIIFPTYVWHRITPITRGTRYVMVGWIHGPTYK